MTDPLDALTKRDDGDVIPESVPYLRLGSGLPAWGWDHEESDLPPPEGNPARGIVIGLIGGIVLWTLLIWTIALAAGWRPWRGIFG